MAGRFKTYWMVPLGLLAVGLMPMMLGIVKAVSIYTAAVTGVVPDIADAAHHFARPLPILLHVLPGILFTLTGPLQFAHSLRARWPRFHRISGRIYILSGLCVVGAALWMNQYYPAYGGWLKYLGVLFIGYGWIISMTLAFIAIRRRNIARHRRWMTRAIAFGLAPGTQTFLAIPLFLIFGMSDLGIGIIVLAGGVINIAIAECIIRKARP